VLVQIVTKKNLRLIHFVTASFLCRDVGTIPTRKIEHTREFRNIISGMGYQLPRRVRPIYESPRHCQRRRDPCCYQAI